ncbi:TauD/TfdA family dioxygenase [Vitiosangium sp. GDMCC 1.1324]|uniref:TauD/TfdA dioxygenase family protein n=1 Tax=Vitiosangium sp. (strain GDMCC 1.1324) TaxID=2138576 RepID=UPI000D3CD19D|nr:TauD/TfdA family dioxygenase [Vitiosangium sp. GDMCC 1.1324]PTL85526.1 TauD/TfdA family dioxygenase [Vitiosangium sp. GDMCC 1.1324]
MKLIPPTAGKLGAELTGIDVRNLSSDMAVQLRLQLYEHRLIVIRDQNLSKQEYIDFANKLGRPQVYFQKNYHHPEHPEIFVSSNVLENGQKVGVAGTGRYWHTDYQFFQDPLPFVMVYPQILPNTRRETYYIDMQRVYEELPDELRAYVENTQAIHDGKWRYKITPEDIDRALIDILNDVNKLVPPVMHPAVIRHPLTGRKSLYISSGFTSRLEGLSYEENIEVMAKLFNFIEREDHIHTHTWRYGDILLWENRALLHKAGDTPKGERSMSYRIGVYDDLPFYANAA